MTRQPLIAWTVSAVSLSAVLCSNQTSAQNYPSRPIRMITAEAGGGNDLVARVIAQGLSPNLGQQIIVDNRGGNAVIPIELAAKAPSDGHTLLVYGSALWLLPFLQAVTYDPLKDVAPIAIGAVTPLVVVVHPSLAVKSIKELIAMAKARPGQLNYASGISGSVTHLPAELFKAMAGVNLVRVAYKGGAPALNAILGGEVPVMFAAAATAAPQISAGRLRALAVTTAQPSALFPGLPTVAQDLPGYESVAITGVFAPPRTPQSLINRLSSEINKALSSPEVAGRFQKSGFEIITTTPEQFTATIKSEMARMGKVIRDAGIRAE